MSRVTLNNNIMSIGEQVFDLKNYDRIHVLGAGKGTVGLFNGLNTVLGRRIRGGVVVSIKEHIPDVDSKSTVTFLPGSHPVPDSSSLKAGEAMIHYIKTEVAAGDLVVFLVTGGTSALLAVPAERLTLEDKIETTRLLLASGARIEEINCVRKHLSAVKGGHLAEKIYPARLVTLILSDIIESPLEHIGSGPTIGDSTTYTDAREILLRYGLINRVPANVSAHLDNGVEGKIADTPLPGAAMFSQNRHILLGDITTALNEAKKCAETYGIPAYILSAADNGEASEKAKEYARLVKKILQTKQPFKPPVLLLSGGELTVTLKGKGKGGRNQEFVLAMLAELKDVVSRDQRFCIFSMGTDGIDGPTDAAGAWIDHNTMDKVKKHGLNIHDYLNDNNSYEFFDTLGQLLKTGPTGTNVMDLRGFFVPTIILT
jgi:glycerate-2-kinase